MEFEQFMTAPCCQISMSALIFLYISNWLIFLGFENGWSWSSLVPFMILIFFTTVAKL